MRYMRARAHTHTRDYQYIHQKQYQTLIEFKKQKRVKQKKKACRKKRKRTLIETDEVRCRKERNGLLPQALRKNELHIRILWKHRISMHVRRPSSD